MANQIGTFFKSQKPETVVPGIADHIKKYWEPRMLKAIYAHVDAGGAGLDHQVLEALQSLKAKAA
jgi:formate dehydrogenase subunit delta